MSEEHLSDKDIKRFVTFEGTLNSEEGKKWMEFAQIVNGHIAGCKDCRDRVREAQELYDALGTISEELGIPKEEGISLFDEIPDIEEEITDPLKDKDMPNFRGKEEAVPSANVEMLIEEYGIDLSLFKREDEFFDASGYSSEMNKFNEEEYNEPGIITLKNKNGETVQLKITQRELIERGIIPEDLGWKSLRQIEEEKKQEEERQSKAKQTKRQVSPEDIARESKSLTTRKVGGIREFFAKLLNKIKGKGEK